MVTYPSSFIRACVFSAMGMAVASVYGATLHVSSAAGGEGDGTAAAPFKTVAAAVDAAGDGDTIVVSKGRYLVTSPLTIDKPGVKVIGITGERPVFTAGDEVTTIFNVIASDVTLQDLIIQGGYYGLKIDVSDSGPSRNVVIRNCVIGSTAADCVKSFNADQLRIEGCQIGPSGRKQPDNAEGIDVIGSLGIAIRGCTIEDVATNGIYLKGGTRDGVVERCLVRRAGHGGILLGQDTDADAMRNNAENEAINCVARNNVIIDTHSAGLGTYSGKNVSFVNNTLLNVAQENQAGVWIVTNSREVPAEQVSIRNNIISVGGDRPLVFFKDAAGLPLSDHNVFYATRGEARVVREMSADDSLNKQWTFAQWQQTTGKDRNSRLAEPKLDAKQFRPMSGSPAISAGDKGAVQDDFFGKRRDANNADAGAVMAAGETASK